MPHFHGENLIEFHVWCTTMHRQGFIPVYTSCINMLGLRHAGAHQSAKHMMRVAHIEKLMSLANMDTSNHTHGRLCIQWSMNIHLQHKPWMYTYTPRLRASMVKEGLLQHLPNLVCPSSEVHDYLWTTYLACIIYISHRAKKKKQTYPHPKGVTKARYKEGKS